MTENRFSPWPSDADRVPCARIRAHQQDVRFVEGLLLGVLHDAVRVVHDRREPAEVVTQEHVQQHAPGLGLPPGAVIQAVG